MTNVSNLASSGARHNFVCEVILTSSRRIEGYVYDPANLDARFVVEFFLDGQPSALMRAQLYDDRLREEGVGDGCYRFSFAVEPEGLDSIASAEVRIANSNQSLGSPVRIAADPSKGKARSEVGEVRWNGGLRFFGWLNDEPCGAQPEVRAFLDGVCIAQSKALRWTHVGDGRDAVAVRGFELHLPAELADGRVRYARFIDNQARTLRGSPCAFFAFKDGLAKFLDAQAEIESERIRGRLYDQVFPQSLPFDSFAEWSRVFPVEGAPANSAAKFAVALVGEHDAAASLASLESQSGSTWVVGVLGGGDGQTSFSQRSLSEFLTTTAEGCDVVVFALAGTVFHANALSRLGECLSSFPRAPLAYCDVTVVSDDGRDWPIAFPSFDYERMLEQGYGAHVFAMPASKARQAAASGADSLYRLFNATLDGRRPADYIEVGAAASALPVHAPGFLARIPPLDLGDGASRLAEATDRHLRARGVRASVKPTSGGMFPSVHVQRERLRVKVSLIVPTRDRVDLLRPCLESLRRTIEIEENELIVVNNDSSDPETLEYFESLTGEGVRIVNVTGPFNFSRLIGAAASVATGEFLLLLNNDVEALSEGWLEEMLRRAVEPDVGVVGAALLWPSRVVQHAGVVVGAGFAAAHAFNDRIDGDPGYADQLVVARECSAVTGACLLTRRSLFLASGGLDGVRFPINYNDIDYCLRLRALGFRVVVTPRAKLLHRESASRGRHQARDDMNRFAFELRNLRAVWGEALMNDPYYSPMLSLDETPFSALAWPPRASAPRVPCSPPARPVPPGF
jgi:GT2 family glycosyltransferase